MPETIIRLQIEALPEGVYLATSNDLPGLVAQGRTIAETVEIAQDVARRLIESLREHGDPLPSAVDVQPLSGSLELTTAIATA